VVDGGHLQNFMVFKLRFHISSTPCGMVLCSLKEDPSFNSPHHVLIQKETPSIALSKKESQNTNINILG